MSGHIKFGSEKTRKRTKRKHAIRQRINGTAERPRLSVFRSAKHVYAQAIDDVTGRVLASASDTEGALKNDGKPKKERARAIGKAIGDKLKAAGVTTVVFDRNGFLYHGRIKELADGARDAGLAF